MRRLLLLLALVCGLDAQPVQVSLTAISGAIGGAVEAIQQGKYIYVSYNNQTGQAAGLAIYDGSNPAAPLLLGQVTVAETTARNVAVSTDGNTAFLIPYDPAPAVIVAIDCTVKSAPVRLSSLALSSTENHAYWVKTYFAGGKTFLLVSLDNANHTLAAVDATNPSAMTRTATVNIGSQAVTLTDFDTYQTSLYGCMGTNAVFVSVIGVDLSNLTAGSPSMSVMGSSYQDGTYKNCKGGTLQYPYYYATASGTPTGLMAVDVRTFTLANEITLSNITEPRHAVIGGGYLYLPSQANSTLDVIQGMPFSLSEKSAFTFTTSGGVIPGVGRSITVNGQNGIAALDGTSSGQVGFFSLYTITPPGAGGTATLKSNASIH